MPKPTWQDMFFVVATLGAQGALLVSGMRRGLWKHWRALGAFLWVSSASTAISLLLLAADAWSGRSSDLIPALYFYAFWYSTLIAGALQLWIIWQIAGRVTGCEQRPWLRRVFLVVTVAAFALAIVIVLRAPDPQFPDSVMRIAVSIDRILWLAWCLLFTALSMSSDLVGLKWRKQIIGISLGFVAQAVGCTLYSWLLKSNNVAALDGLTGSTTLLSLAIWALALRESPYPTLSPSARTTFEATLRNFETVEKGIRTHVR